MKIGTFLPSARQWEDWVMLVLGIWLCASPWVLQFANDEIATQNAFGIGLVLILFEMVTLSLFSAWEEWINVILGAWLVASPWVLGITALAPRVEFVVVGVFVLALALYEFWDVRGRSAHPA